MFSIDRSLKKILNKKSRSSLLPSERPYNLRAGFNILNKGVSSRPLPGFFIRKDTFSRNMPFVRKTTVPIIDYPEEYSSIREKSIVDMNPSEFLRLAKRTSENTSTGDSKQRIRNLSQEDYEKEIREDHKIQRIKQGLHEGKDIPMGYIEYDSDRDMPLEHEGRHRALAARELGMETIPVALVRQRKLVPQKGTYGHYQYGEDEYVQHKQFPEYKEIKRNILPFTYKSDKYSKNFTTEEIINILNKKKLEDQQNFMKYKQEFNKVQTPKEKAYVALKVAAQNNMKFNEPIQRHQRIFEMQRAVENKPIGQIVTTRGTKDIILNENQSREFGEQMDLAMNNILVVDEAQENLSKELFGKGYYSLPPKERNKVKYLLRTQHGRY